MSRDEYKDNTKISYSLVNRRDEDLLQLCQTEGIAWLPFFPLEAFFPVCEKSQKALSANVLSIPGTCSIKHLEKNRVLAQMPMPKMGKIQWMPD